MSFFQRYGKTIAAAVTAVIVVVQAALSDGHFTQAEQFQVAIAVCTAVTVYVAPNLPRYPWVKLAAAVIGAALTTAVTLIDNGISAADWSAVILGGLGVVLVGAAPAQLQQPRAVAAQASTVPLRTTGDSDVREPL